MSTAESFADTRTRISGIMGYTNLHLDFHNPVFQKGIGEDFDGEAFAKRLKEANIDSITFFANCYHGFSYYDTKVGTKHPGLERDLLSEAIAGCRHHGINIIVYLSTTADTNMGLKKPEWAQLDHDGERLVFPQRGWMCMHSQYVEEVLFPQIDELTAYDIDGFFFDELYYHANGCFCPNCSQEMENLALDINDSDHRRDFIKATLENLSERIYTRCTIDSRDRLVVFNPSVTLLGIMGGLSKNENCALVGGHEAGWGGGQFPAFHRYVRNLNRPVLAMTGIFHRTWAEFGTVKHEAQLEWEIAQRLAHHFRVSIGDHLRPEGVLDEAKYKTIERVFKRVKTLSLPDGEPIRDIAVIYPGEKDYRNFRAVTPYEEHHTAKINGINGAAKFLVESHQQFDVLDEDTLQQMLDRFRMVILPETGPLEERTVEAIRQFVAGGGLLLASGNSSLNEGKFDLEDVFGIEYTGKEYGFSRAYIDLLEYRKNVPEIKCVSYSDFSDVHTTTGIVKAWVIAPWGEENIYTIDLPGPPGDKRMGPAIVHNKYGKGQVVYFATDIFRQYYKMDYYGHKTILDNIVDSLYPKRVLHAEAPPTLWINAMDTAKGVYIHILNYHATPQAGVFPRITFSPPSVCAKIEYYAPKATKVESITGMQVDFEREGDYMVVKFETENTHEILCVS